MFRWLGSEQLIPVSVVQTLALVDGLRAGRTIARETEPIGPVDDRTVDATLPHLPAVVADMVRFERLTGTDRPKFASCVRATSTAAARSGCSHRKATRRSTTASGGLSALVPAGRKSCSAIWPATPRAIASGRATLRRSDWPRSTPRSTPLSCGNRPGSNRKRRPKRSPGERYEVASYRRAIHRACDKAFPAPKEIDSDPAKLSVWQSEHRWSPNQLRHSAATEIRRQFGVEAAQHVLGHATTNMTEVYAEKNLETAARVAAQVG